MHDANLGILSVSMIELSNIQVTVSGSPTVSCVRGTKILVMLTHQSCHDDMSRGNVKQIIVYEAIDSSKG